MSSISGVDFPKSITYGTPFNVTVHYTADPGATAVFVTGLNHLSVRPTSIAVDSAKNTAPASLTIDKPAGTPPAIAMVRFTLGVADWTSAATASP
jgi:hypothetical protein